MLLNRNMTHTWLMVIAATFFWGSNFNAAHAIAGQLPPLTAAAERFGMAVLVLAVMRLWRGKPEAALSGKDMVALCVLGLIGVFGFNTAFFTALRTTSALNAALIMALSPLLTNLLSVWLLRARISGIQLLGIGIAFSGVALVITGSKLTILHVAVGDLWMLGACLAWSFYSVLVRKHAAHIPSAQQARWTVTAGAIALIIFALLHDRPLPLIAQQSTSTLLILVYMATCGTVLAYLFWLRGIQELGPQRAVMAFNLVPVFTLLINLALGQLPQLLQFVGMALVFAGVLISSGWRPLRRAPVVTLN
jgi:drug/metabolite transporter (DMT)-like permease